MDTELIVKLAKGEKITDTDIADALYEICSSVHASCNDECPVFKLNESWVPDNGGTTEGCDCFKNGKAMLTFIRRKAK